jgi:hypothetical protein
MIMYRLMVGLFLVGASPLEANESKEDHSSIVGRNFNELPDDAQREVGRWLPYQDLFTLMRVNQKLYKNLQHNKAERIISYNFYLQAIRPEHIRQMLQKEPFAERICQRLREERFPEEISQMLQKEPFAERTCRILQEESFAEDIRQVNAREEKK